MVSKRFCRNGLQILGIALLAQGCLQPSLRAPSTITDTTTSPPSSPPSCTSGGVTYTLANTTTQSAPSFTYQGTAASNSQSAAFRGVYPVSVGMGGTSYFPGSRDQSCSWVDSSGNFWVFGGDGIDSTGASGYLNDLWEYIPGSQSWTWVSGSKTANQFGAYSLTEYPGGREHMACWADTSGNLYVFGGIGYAASGGAAELNDLWSFNTGSQVWDFISGATTASSIGDFGAQGAPSLSNTPSARQGPGYVTDASGNFWLVGGKGMDSVGGYGVLNDVWFFNSTTLEWTWMGGNDTVTTQTYFPASIGTGGAGYYPGGREDFYTWIDSSGNPWVFGGYGRDISGSANRLSDLWEFNTSLQEWIWQGGQTLSAQSGIYGCLLQTTTTAIPGARTAGANWIDSAGKFWLYGGNGFDSTGTQIDLNDLWMYDPSAGYWTWMGGASSGTQNGVYGTIGVSSTTGLPGSRTSFSGATDPSGNFWFFGGYGYDGSGSLNFLGDLWTVQ